MSVNKVILIGRLGQDPEIKYTPGGAVVANFTVATSDRWVDKGGEKKERTEWHRIATWGKLAETCGTYLKKGASVYIEGSLTTRQWEKDGQKHQATSINASNIQFLGDKKNTDTKETDSDIPF